jgi:hypothetical protein
MQFKRSPNMPEMMCVGGCIISSKLGAFKSTVDRRLKAGRGCLAVPMDRGAQRTCGWLSPSRERHGLVRR